MVNGNKFIVLANGNYIGCKDEKALEFTLQETEIFQVAIYNVYRRNKKGHLILYPYERKFGNVKIYPVSLLDDIIGECEKQYNLKKTDFSRGKELK